MSVPLTNECMAQWNIVIGSLKALKNLSCVLLPLLFLYLKQKARRYFTMRATYFSHTGSLTRTNRKRYNDGEQERRLKSSSEKALGRDYGDLKPLLPPRLLPMVFRGGRERNEDSPSVHPAPHLSLPFYTVAAIRPVRVRAHVHGRE